jgi:hypothetical protein
VANDRRGAKKKKADLVSGGHVRTTLRVVLSRGHRGETLRQRHGLDVSSGSRRPGSNSDATEAPCSGAASTVMAEYLPVAGQTR